MEYLGHELREERMNGHLVGYIFKETIASFDKKKIVRVLNDYSTNINNLKYFYITHDNEQSLSTVIRYSHVNYREGGWNEPSRYVFSIEVDGYGFEIAEVYVPDTARFTVRIYNNEAIKISGIKYSYTNILKSKNISNTRRSRSYDNNNDIYNMDEYMRDNGYDPENDSIEDMYGMD